MSNPPIATAPQPTPERADAVADRWAHWPMQVLDELDHGIVVLDRAGTVRLANAQAQRELDDEHPLQLSAGVLQARRNADAAAWREALRAERRRCPLLTLGDAPHRVSLALLPLADPEALMLLLGRRHSAVPGALQAYALSHALTPAETRVLTALCAGTAPERIAHEQGVRLSTVRTQVASLRGKTGTRSIPELVRGVALLPPLRAAVRDVNRSQAADCRFPPAGGDDFLC